MTAYIEKTFQKRIALHGRAVLKGTVNIDTTVNNYEYGNKVSIAGTAIDNLVVGVACHPCSEHDSYTLPSN